MPKNSHRPRKRAATESVEIWRPAIVECQTSPFHYTVERPKCDIVAEKGKRSVERSIEKYLIQQTKQRGALALKFTSPGASGVPDRLIIRPGHPVEFVELKRPGGKLRPVQAAMIRRLEALGQTVTVIDSKDGVDQFWSART